jgi:hypothetical protein
MATLGTGSGVSSALPSASKSDKNSVTEQSALLLHSSRQDSAGRFAVSNCDAEVERMGNKRFTLLAALVCGLGNASDAVELLAISFILPNLDVETDSSAEGKHDIGTHLSANSALTCNWLQQYCQQQFS